MKTLSWIDEKDMKAIRQQADIVDVIGQYLTLTKKGKNYVATCPFHDDHDPSLSISTDKQIFKCFVCGTGGNVFTFVQKMEQISFPEAVIKVAQMIHYPLHLPEHAFTRTPKKEQPLYDLLQAYIQYARYELQSEDGYQALDYLRKRNINEDIIKRFEIGFVGDAQKSLKFFKAKGFDPQMLLQTGLVMTGETDLYPAFHQRILIPIHDAFGNPIAFTARTLVQDKSEPKYINTGQTVIYEKGKVIFNYHRAKEFARKKNQIIITEGAMDVIAFEKADIHESVATLGTACTQSQMDLLKQLRVPVIVCYDGDAAGKSATYKFGKLAVSNGLSIQIVKNDTTKDPDEILQEYGKEELYSFVDKTISYPEFLIDYLRTVYNLDNYEDKKKYAKEIYDVVDMTCDDFEKSGYISRLRSITGFDFSTEVKPQKNIKEKHQKISIHVDLPQSGRIHAEHAILNMILMSKKAANRFQEEIGFFKDQTSNQLYLYCFDFYRKTDMLDWDILMEEIKEEDVRNLLVSLLLDPTRMNHFESDYFEDALIKIKECAIQDQIEILNQQIEQMANPLEKGKLAIKKQQLIIQKNELRKGV